MKKICFFTLLFFIIYSFSSCLAKNKEKNKEENNLIVTDSYFIDVLMENDTLGTGLEKGIIKIFYKAYDTIKFSPNNERTIFTMLTLKPKKSNKEIEGGQKIEKELIINPINANDTIFIPFTIKPHFVGNGAIVGGVSDVFQLETSDKEKVRMLTSENIFEKEVYIKEE